MNTRNWRPPLFLLKSLSMSHKVEVTIPEGKALFGLLKHPIVIALLSPLFIWGIIQIYEWNTHDSEIKPKVEILEDSVIQLTKDRQEGIIDAADEKLINLAAEIGDTGPTNAQRALSILYGQQKKRAERALEDLQQAEATGELGSADDAT